MVPVSFVKKIHKFVVCCLVIGQDYETHVSPEYVILGNDVLLKCGIPSFVTDFVQITAWIQVENQIEYHQNSMGKKGVFLGLSSYVFFD